MKVNAGWLRQQVTSHHKLIVGLLLLAILLQCVLSMRVKTVTFDEPRHVLAGYSYLKKGDFSLNWENPPLINVIAAAPLLFLQPKIPAHFQEKYAFMHEFLYGSNDNADQIIFWARIPIVLLSLLLGFFVFKWTSELYGTKAGLFSLLIYAFSPNILAHSRLATTDLGLSCFMFLACYRLWKFGSHPSARNLLLAGLTLGLTLTSKFTAVFLLPVYLGFPFVQLFLKERTEERPTGNGSQVHHPADLLKRGSKLMMYSILIMSMGLLAIGAAYPFSLRTPGREYVEGLQWSLGHSERGHDAFLWGQISQKGWWYYHLVALAIKTPIALQIMLLLAIYASLSHSMKKTNFYQDFFIVLPPILLLTAVSAGSVKIGLRHVLPIFPFIFVFIGRLLEPVPKRRLFPIAALCLTVWYLLSSIIIYPHYLAYFNEYVGGPANGYKYLVDSNLDWGQDLKGLKTYLESRNIGKVKLAYFGIADPQYCGISYEPISDQDLLDLKEGRFTRDVFAISATFLQGLYLPDRDRYQWFKNRPPTAQIGYSIFVYQVDCRKERMAEGAQGPVFSPPTIQHPLPATLGNQIQFLGYDLDPVSIKPGQTLHLALYWQALAEMDESYTVFTHLLDKENRIWGQKDNVPVEGTLPTCCWTKDEIITDEYEILLQPDAPPGQYVIEIGMYQLETGQRLEVRDGPEREGNRILLSTVEVSDQPLD